MKINAIRATILTGMLGLAFAMLVNTPSEAREAEEERTKFQPAEREGPAKSEKEGHDTIVGSEAEDIIKGPSNAAQDLSGYIINSDIFKRIPKECEAINVACTCKYTHEGKEFSYSMAVSTDIDKCVSIDLLSQFFKYPTNSMETCVALWKVWLEPEGISEGIPFLSGPVCRVDNWSCAKGCIPE